MPSALCASIDREESDSSSKSGVRASDWVRKCKDQASWPTMKFDERLLLSARKLLSLEPKMMEVT